MKKSFALIGAAGYVAPRHLRAIRETGNTLVAAMDKFDSVGILDSYFPEADFFTEIERFDRHLEKRKNNGFKLDFLSVCSPNYLHDAHIRFGLRHGADVICEKPLVLNPWNLEGLIKNEIESGQKVNTILQLRLHPSIVRLKEKVDSSPGKQTFEFDLTYLTSRGKWYYAGWKGDESKSGGIATNIGIHFFDMLGWIFGPLKSNIVHINSHDRASGYLEFKKARVRWFLGINSELLPNKAKSAGLRTYRSIQLNGEEIEFSDGFADLHTESYRKILSGKGFGLKTVLPSIQLVHDIRNSEPIGLKGDYHPLAKIDLSPHPFDIKPS